MTPDRRVSHPLVILLALVAAVVAFAVAYVVAAPVDRGLTQSAAGSVTIQGDADCSGDIEVSDGAQVLRARAGVSAADCTSAAGDVDCSGDADAVDALWLFRFAAGLSGSPPECTPIGEELVAGASSYQLIQEALDRGEIDSETALVYKLFVTFNDPRLPAEYKGDDKDAWDDPMAVAKASSTFGELIPETQQIVAPFLLPPDDPGSWQQTAQPAAVAQAPAITYSRIDSSPHVTIAYRNDRPGDAALAQDLANEVDGRIWSTLTGLMGDPVPDTARQPNNGGDGRIDIWLTGDATRAYAASLGCEQTSGYIVLGLNGANKYVLTHELMHVINYHFDTQGCWHDEYRWIHEATSQWSMDLVYSSADEEQSSAIPSCFLDVPTRPLEYRNDCHEYAAYLLPFYLARTHDKQYVRKIWDAFAAKDSLGGINAALAPLGGLKEVWPKFAVENYNREPDTVYQDDSISEAAHLEAEQVVSLGGSPRQTYVILGDVDHLAAYYFLFDFQDQSIKEVVFRHELEGQQTARVNALVLYENALDFVVEDWTDSPKRLCYDDAGQQKIEKLVIVISNSEYQNRSHVLQSNPQPELEVNDECGSGSHTATYHWANDGYREDWRVTADVEWVEDPDYLFGCNCRTFFAEGDINWEWEWHYDGDPECDDFDSGHLLAGQGLDHRGQQMLILWEVPNQPDKYAYTASGYVPAAWFSDCENGDREGLDFVNIAAPVEVVTTTPTFPSFPITAQGAIPDCKVGPFLVDKDAPRITGSCVDNGGDYFYEWDFKVTSAQ